MHGWDLDVKEKKELKIYRNENVVIIQIYSDTEKARESHICIIPVGFFWKWMRFTLLFALLQ